MSANARQLDLFEGRSSLSPQALLDRLKQVADRPITLRLTDNRVSMAWIDFSRRGMIRVSLDEQYLWAPEYVIDAICDYVRWRRKADWQVIATFARRVPERTGAGRVERLRSKGEVYDLKEIRDEVNGEHFGGAIQCRIGWGRNGVSRRRQRRSIRFGSWNSATRTIRIHPALDAASVPREFLRYIVFHEMLHAAIPGEQRAGRSIHHPSEFQALERRYPDYEQMKQLGTRLLHALASDRK